MATTESSSLSTLPADGGDAELVARLSEARETILEEVQKIIVGQTEVLEQLVLAILCRGHCLLEGVPGLAKTVMVQTLGQILDMSFSRIQFTPDLMPSDITGTDIIQEDPETGRRQLEFLPGPLFSHLVLADEINRTPPKTQAALLEAMQERRTTCRGRTYELPDPFFVLATQNPIEQEGTYNLPEAQLDRFMFMVKVDYPTKEEEIEVLRRTTGDERPTLKRVFDAASLIKLQHLVRQVPVADHVYDYVVDLVHSTRPGHNDVPDATRWLQWGAGPRAGQQLILGGKARALIHGRFHVSTDDIAALAKPVLRHRIVCNFAAQTAGLSSDEIIDRLVDHLDKSTKSAHS
ncbi:ATPase family associated with various cellular activities (AAA) [Planctomycetes bacterium Pan216]|uniref:ATPase family associated with various cellular activities (AAA) n=1 Tax=Kolteria novifilia TaxID=2527975 RepID=A0A518AZD2_9BACT|nr:ATPase family associated with various cellular activities (AAA) [Planctomycetes bacterium Pan216]